MMSALLLLVLLPAVDSGAERVLLGIAAAATTWFGLLVIERGLLRTWILGQRANGSFGASVLVMGGSTSSTVKIARFLADNPVLGFDVRGVLCPAGAEVDASGFARWGDEDDLATAVHGTSLTGVVLDASTLNGQLNPAVQLLTESNLHAHIHSGLRGVERRRITLSPMVDETFLHVGPLGLGARQRVAKRVLDVAVAGALLALTMPLLLVSAMLVRLDGGPVLFRQRRIGHDGEPFTMLKLRTMRVDAEVERAALSAANVRDGPLFKMASDPRVTSVGRFLRATSIDELPQLLNVLEGTMSMVGPRPALPDEAAQFDDELTARLSVKPGLTGLWQVEARDLPSFDLYRRLDLLYVQNWSLGVDVTIIVRTAAVVLMRALRVLIPFKSLRARAWGLE
jgi:exopolysaccharide biosynthesis polyprenyl glycosylphosphotransferase